MCMLVASGRVTHVHACRVWCVQWSSEVVSCCVSLSMLPPLCPAPVGCSMPLTRPATWSVRRTEMEMAG